MVCVGWGVGENGLLCTLPLCLAVRPRGSESCLGNVLPTLSPTAVALACQVHQTPVEGSISSCLFPVLTRGSSGSLGPAVLGTGLLAMLGCAAGLRCLSPLSSLNYRWGPLRDWLQSRTQRRQHRAVLGPAGLYQATFLGCKKNVSSGTQAHKTERDSKQAHSVAKAPRVQGPLAGGLGTAAGSPSLL